MPTLSHRSAWVSAALCIALAPHASAQAVVAPAATPPVAPPATYPPPPPGYQYVPAAAPTAAAPPGYPPPPPGYQYVPAAGPPPAAPAGFAPPPPGFQYVPLKASPTPTGQSTPDTSYQEGDPVPPGYRVREQPRYGLVTAGYIITAIPYAISATAALSANFDNKSGYLMVPFFGPWMTIGQRKYGDCDHQAESNDDWTCVADVLVVTGLVMDGIMQVTGGALLLTGYLTTTKKLVRTNASLTLKPQAIGTGYGLGASGTF